MIRVSLLILMLLATFTLHAHDTSQTINIDNSTHYHGSANNGSSGMGEIRTSVEEDIAKGVATAASMSFCQFDYSPAFQACVGTATYNDEWGLNFQVGKRVDTLLFTGGFACDDEIDECAAGGAVSWHF